MDANPRFVPEVAGNRYPPGTTPPDPKAREPLSGDLEDNKTVMTRFNAIRQSGPDAERQSGPVLTFG